MQDHSLSLFGGYAIKDFPACVGVVPATRLLRTVESCRKHRHPLFRQDAVLLVDHPALFTPVHVRSEFG